MRKEVGEEGKGNGAPWVLCLEAFLFFLQVGILGEGLGMSGFSKIFIISSGVPFCGQGLL